MPQSTVVAAALLIRFYAICVEELDLVPLTEVPLEAQGRNREVDPTITDSEVTEVDVAGPLPSCRDEYVQRACVPMNESRVNDWRPRPQGRRRTSEPSLSRPPGGDEAAETPPPGCGRVDGVGRRKAFSELQVAGRREEERPSEEHPRDERGIHTAEEQRQRAEREAERPGHEQAAHPPA
jgi:hypothetical protein